jgi:hypothetical protein
VVALSHSPCRNTCQIRRLDVPNRFRLRSKIPALTEALIGGFTEHHAFLARVHLNLID